MEREINYGFVIFDFYKLDSNFMKEEDFVMKFPDKLTVKINIEN